MAKGNSKLGGGGGNANSAIRAYNTAGKAVSVWR